MLKQLLSTTLALSSSVIAPTSMPTSVVAQKAAAPVLGMATQAPTTPKPALSNKFIQTDYNTWKGVDISPTNKGWNNNGKDGAFYSSVANVFFDTNQDSQDALSQLNDQFLVMQNNDPFINPLVSFKAELEKWAEAKYAPSYNVKTTGKDLQDFVTQFKASYDVAANDNQYFTTQIYLNPDLLNVFTTALNTYKVPNVQLMQGYANDLINSIGSNGRLFYFYDAPWKSAFGGVEYGGAGQLNSLVNAISVRFDNDAKGTMSSINDYIKTNVQQTFAADLLVANEIGMSQDAAVDAVIQTIQNSIANDPVYKPLINAGKWFQLLKVLDQAKIKNIIDTNADFIKIQTTLSGMKSTFLSDFNAFSSDLIKSMSVKQHNNFSPSGTINDQVKLTTILLPNSPSFVKFKNDFPSFDMSKFDTLFKVTALADPAIAPSITSMSVSFTVEPTASVFKGATPPNTFNASIPVVISFQDFVDSLDESIADDTTGHPLETAVPKPIDAIRSMTLAELTDLTKWDDLTKLINLTDLNSAITFSGIVDQYSAQIASGKNLSSLVIRNAHPATGLLQTADVAMTFEFVDKANSNNKKQFTVIFKNVPDYTSAYVDVAASQIAIKNAANTSAPDYKVDKQETWRPVTFKMENYFNSDPSGKLKTDYSALAMGTAVHIDVANFKDFITFTGLNKIEDLGISSGVVDGTFSLDFIKGSTNEGDMTLTLKSLINPNDPASVKTFKIFVFDSESLYQQLKATTPQKITDKATDIVQGIDNVKNQSGSFITEDMANGLKAGMAGIAADALGKINNANDLGAVQAAMNEFDSNTKSLESALKKLNSELGQDAWNQEFPNGIDPANPPSLKEIKDFMEKLKHSSLADVAQKIPTAKLNRITSAVVAGLGSLLGVVGVGTLVSSGFTLAARRKVRHMKNAPVRLQGFKKLFTYQALTAAISIAASVSLLVYIFVVKGGL